MRIFREYRDGARAVDLNRLTESLQRGKELDAELARTIAQLAVDMPGDAAAVAAAGVAYRARINNSASMIELGSAAVDALRRGGWQLTPPALVEPTPVDSRTLRERAQAERRKEQRINGIPDDWAQ